MPMSVCIFYSKSLGDTLQMLLKSFLKAKHVMESKLSHIFLKCYYFCTDFTNDIVYFNFTISFISATSSDDNSQTP